MDRSDFKSAFPEGVRDGIPIALGYFAVSFSLGIAARNVGVTAVQGMLASFLCMASAGQYALFSLCSDPTVAVDELPVEENSFRRIVIPAEVKLEIRDKLDYINISERMIYPGLSGICRWITRRYAALGPRYNRPNKEE